MDLKDLYTSTFVRHFNFDLSIKPTRSFQGRIYRIRPVGSSDDNYLTSSFQAIHKRQKLRYNSPLHFASYLLPLRRNRVNFIDKYYRGRLLFRLLKNLSKTCFRLSVEFTHNLRSGAT